MFESGRGQDHYSAARRRRSQRYGPHNRLRSHATQPASYRVVIYSHTDKWYVQPYVAAPKTTINSDGTWRVQIHLGAEYAALIVKPAYDPPATSIGLPSPDGNNILAVNRKEAQ